MSQIQYRAIEKRDYEAVCEIINQSFYLYAYIKKEKVLEEFKKNYIYGCLAEATYTCVAEKDGVIVGIIMGNAKAKYSIVQHMLPVIKMIYHSWRMKCLGKKEEGVKTFQHLHEIYHSFNKKHKGMFDGVLTLFAVSKEARGFGIGKRLWRRLYDYLKENNVHQIYLYTDSNCNTGFYDKQGFRRIEEETLNVVREGKTVPMAIYLYEYKIMV